MDHFLIDLMETVDIDDEKFEYHQEQVKQTRAMLKKVKGNIARISRKKMA